MTIALLIATAEERHLPPLTDVLPDVLLPIIDRPVMAVAVELLARAGIKRILIALHEQSAPITAAFGSGKRWGVDIEYVTLQEAWGDGGALRWAGPLINETCLVWPGNAIIDLPIETALAHHQAHGGPLTVITHPAREYAHPEAAIAEDGTLRAVLPAKSDGNVVTLTGAYLIEPSLIAQIPLRKRCQIVTDLLPHLLEQHIPIHNFTFSGYWNPLTTLASYHEAQQVFLYSAYRTADPTVTDGPRATVRYPSIRGRQIAPGVWVGRNDSIHPSARIAPPLYIGDNCWIGRDVELGPGTVIGADCMIDDEATVTASTVWADTYIGQLVNVDRRIVYPGMIIDPESGEQTAIVDPFLIGRVSAATVNTNRLTSVLNRIGALLILIALSPLFLFTGLLAAIGSGGRPLVRLPRVGERVTLANGQTTFRPLNLWRWRTRHADGRPLWFGAWLEACEFHRLPELLNVINGDLHLVGIKPLSPNEVELLHEAWQQRRYEVPPGITGLWYVQAAGDLDSIVVADVYYSATHTWQDDLKILLRTPRAWWHRMKATKVTSEIGVAVKADLAPPR
ncbi:sugar transferase [Chloroflexus sp.]|uniref:sugar transferase n=1 Tax=Chloroflexus sp. TaxID=1904827 RepID=UPI00260E2530|nr:sugar transferase [uncultured Chloroflexus sp.]